MIGYYVHHQGRGHANRALAIASVLGATVTGLSSLPRPAGWPGDWVRLERDDLGTVPQDAGAGGRLHWVPVHDAGLRSRMSAIARWIDTAAPSVMVVDVSVEVALLARLHGVPVVTVALPGDRGDDPHALGFDIADVVLACWPAGTTGMVRGISESAAAKLHPVGAIARFSRRGSDPAPEPGTVLVLAGAGGSGFAGRLIDRARSATPGWRWTVLDGTPGRWVDDPWSAICSAEVVVTHAGQNALAEVAAAGRPAIVLAQDRPHDEQASTARALEASGAYPVIVCSTWPESGWADLLERARGFDCRRWALWNDGRGAERAAEMISRIADRAAAGSAA